MSSFAVCRSGLECTVANCRFTHPEGGSPTLKDGYQ